MTLPSPMVSRSVHTGMVADRNTTSLPIVAPSVRRYSEYSGEPTKARSGLDRRRVFTTQNRR